MTSSVDGLRRNSKGLPKAKLAPRKDTVTVWWSAACLIHYSSLNPMKPLHLRRMLSKSVRCTENRKACGHHRSRERARLSSTTVPNGASHKQRFESRMNRATKFCLIRHIHLTSRQPIATSSSISTTFCRENTSTTRRQKVLSKSLSNPEAWIFTLQE